MSNDRAPRRMEAPFAGLMERLGLTAVDLDGLPQADGEEYMPHDTWLEQRPGDAEYREMLGEPRSCPGMLRIVERDDALWVVRCDACGWDTGVNMQTVDPERLSDRRLALANIPAMFAGKRFERGDSEQEPTLRACREWLSRVSPRAVEQAIPAVALYGRSGRGKSHLLSVLVETLVQRNGVDATYRSSIELFDTLRAGFDEATYEQHWQRIVRVPILALDDLGAERRTPWRDERLAALVDHRYAKQLPLLVATNIPPVAWEREFGERTASRMRGMMLRFELKGADRREHVQERLVA